MTAQVLLLRGVNVGGHGRLPMADLRALLDAKGAGGAQTYLQSGNAICPAAVDPAPVAEAIAARHGFRPAIIALSAGDWRARVATNPFPTDAPKALHGVFHDGEALDLAPFERLRAASERLSAHPGVLWLHAPDGIGSSKLAASLDRLAGRPVTARNWSTLAALTALLESPPR